MRIARIFLLCVCILSLALPALAQSNMQGLFNAVQGAVQGQKQGQDATAAGAGLSALSTGDMHQGLKTALGQAVQYAISQLGAADGFLGNQLVRIAMPKELNTLASGLEAVGQKKLVDDFVTSMNRAAEKAVPATAEILGKSVQDLTIDDAKAILQGPEDAATQHFEQTSRSALHQRIQPIVTEAMDSARVTYYYDLLRKNAGGVTSFLTGGDVDLDQYVTNGALDGLFLTMAKEEADIRANPLAQKADILQKVFGAVK